MPWEAVVVVVVGTAGFVGMRTLHAKIWGAEERRRRRSETYATRAGWGFSLSAPELAAEYFGVPPFSSGSRPQFDDVVYHTDGTYQGHSFDFSFGIGPSNDEYRHYQHVVSLLLPAPLPPLSLRPEYATDSLGKGLGLQDIQFESEDFNRAWLVRGVSAAAVHDVLHPRTMEWLMQSKNRNLTFGISGRYVFIAVAGQQQPKRIPDVANRLVKFYRLIPGFVWGKARGAH